MKSDYSRTVSMQCSTCGGTAFEFEDECSPIRCVGCDRIFIREELVRENGTRTESEVEDVTAQLVADIRKDFSNIFKKFK